jgi:tetratricopeptide (TPR) repeat protein
MHEPGWKKFFVTVSGVRQGPKPLMLTITPAGKPARTIRYSLTQTQRLKVMACAADGEAFCPEILATGALSPELDRLSNMARASQKRGDDNFVLRRGAMLHADVAMAVQGRVGPRPYDPNARSHASPAPDQVTLDLFDGSAIGSREVGIHWILARMLLDEVVPHGSRKPAPERDDLVRDWYRATAAWMQHVEDHDSQHLDRARELFGGNPDILFLSGCQRETFAAPRIQHAIQSTAVPAGLRFDIASDQKEARRAEEFFRRAVAVRPDMAEAHLHLGHVLLLRGNDSEAAVHLRQARAGLTDPLLHYYAALMLGAAEGHLAHYDAARESYESAAVLQPTAQAPLIGLSELARRRGDRSAALRELDRVFALPANALERDDPWWRYATSHVRHADALVDGLRQSVLRAGPKPEE